MKRCRNQFDEGCRLPRGSLLATQPPRPMRQRVRGNPAARGQVAIRQPLSVTQHEPALHLSPSVHDQHRDARKEHDQMGFAERLQRIHVRVPGRTSSALPPRTGQVGPPSPRSKRTRAAPCPPCTVSSRHTPSSVSWPSTVAPARGASKRPESWTGLMSSSPRSTITLNSCMSQGRLGVSQSPSTRWMSFRIHGVGCWMAMPQPTGSGLRASARGWPAPHLPAEMNPRQRRDSSCLLACGTCHSYRCAACTTGYIMLASNSGGRRSGWPRPSAFPLA